MKDTDLELCPVCLGTDSFGDKRNEEQAFEMLDMFVRSGINFIDTANVYCRWIPGAGNSSEQIIGKWLKSRNACKNVVIATKGGHYDIADPQKTSRVTEADIRHDLEESLQTLGLDVIDFYWLHRDDLNRPVEEIVDLLETLKKEGKIRYYGLSNYRTDRLARAKEYLERQGKKGPYAVSNQWSLASINPGGNTNPDPTLVEFSKEEYDWHVQSQVPVIPFSSTAKGFFEKLKKAGVEVKDGLITKIAAPEYLPEPLVKAYVNEENIRTYEKLLNIQKETGHSLQALSVAWLLARPFQVFPISSVRNEEQLKELLKALDIDWKTYD